MTYEKKGSEAFSFEFEAEDWSGTLVPLGIPYSRTQVWTGTYVSLRVAFITSRNQQLPVMRTCAVILNTSLYKHQETLLHLEMLVALLLFTRALGDCLWGHIQRSKTRAPRMIGAWCVSLTIVDKNEVSVSISMNQIFLWDYEERMEHGRGALQLLHLFLLQALLTFSPSALLVDMDNNANIQFCISIQNTQKTHICRSLARWPIQELLKI